MLEKEPKYNYKENDISRELNWYSEVRSRMIIKNLKHRNMNGQYVETRQEALSSVLEMIPPGAVVARGDSVTLFQIDIITELLKRNQNKLINPFPEGAFPPQEERRKLQREALLADIFLTGTNAITLKGQLVNTDGAGNRVAAITFGPKKVIVVAGYNKIVKDIEEGLARIRNWCTQNTGRRHYLKHQLKESATLNELPCVKTGVCVDCNHVERPCNHTVITEGAFLSEKGRINVVLVGEDLGI